MVYVARDSEGRVCDLQDAPLGDALEALPGDHPDVLQFLHERWRQHELDRLDLDFVRVIEDLIEVMIGRNLILFTDLPPKVQEKLARRREIRQQTGYGNGYGGDDLIPL